MSGCYDDDIAVLREDIKRYSGHDARIDEALEQLCKLYQSEVDALAEEARLLEGAFVRQTTRLEEARIRQFEQRPNWGSWTEPRAR